MSRNRAQALERDSGPLESRLVTGLAKIGLAIKHGARREAAAHGLSATQAEILTLLRRPGGPASPKQVARDLGIGLPTVSEALGPLVRKGLVRKERSAPDRRAVALALTPAGRAEADRLAGWPDFLLEGVGALSAAEQAVLLRAVVKLIGALQEQGRIPVAKMCPTCRYFRPNVHPEDPERPHHCAFVDAPFGERAVRIDCPDHEPAVS